MRSERLGIMQDAQDGMGLLSDYESSSVIFAVDSKIAIETVTWIGEYGIELCMTPGSVILKF